MPTPLVLGMSRDMVWRPLAEDLLRVPTNAWLLNLSSQDDIFRRFSTGQFDAAHFDVSVLSHLNQMELYLPLGTSFELLEGMLWLQGHDVPNQVADFLSLKFDYILKRASSFDMSSSTQVMSLRLIDWLADIDQLTLKDDALPMLEISHLPKFLHPICELTYRLLFGKTAWLIMQQSRSLASLSNLRIQMFKLLRADHFEKPQVINMDITPLLMRLLGDRLVCGVWVKKKGCSLYLKFTQQLMEQLSYVETKQKAQRDLVLDYVDNSPETQKLLRKILPIRYLMREDDLESLCRFQLLTRHALGYLFMTQDQWIKAAHPQTLSMSYS